MCLILFAHNYHPKFKLVLAANRDEYYDRPTSRAAFWEDAPFVFGGRDLRCGGSWLGVTKDGRVAAVANYRDSQLNNPNAPSRGLLVSDFLRGNQTPEEYIAEVRHRAGDLNGFNLLLGNQRCLYYLSNRGVEPKKLNSGIWGISNHLLDSPWPKVVRGKESLARILSAGGPLEAEMLFDVLADREQALDKALSNTGLPLEMERMLSPLFVSGPAYGTRSSTVLIIDGSGNLSFVERSFQAGTQRYEEVSQGFRICADRR